jgi:hypothetical protein
VALLIIDLVLEAEAIGAVKAIKVRVKLLVWPVPGTSGERESSGLNGAAQRRIGRPCRLPVPIDQVTVHLQIQRGRPEASDKSSDNDARQRQTRRDVLRYWYPSGLR